MSAWGWTECPRGCKSYDHNKEGEPKCVRIDFEYDFGEEGAWVYMLFECQVCGVKCKLEAKKAPKKVIKELVFDEPDEEFRRR
jgi:hypothetical protein